MTQRQHPIGTGFTAASTADDVLRVGVYLEDNDISPLDEDPKPIAFGTEPVVASTVVPHAIDLASAERLWDLSEQLLKA